MLKEETKYELEKRTIKILEDTKTKAEQYKKERKKLDQYLRGNNKILKWEKYIIQLEKKIGDDKK